MGSATAVWPCGAAGGRGGVGQGTLLADRGPLLSRLDFLGIEVAYQYARFAAANLVKRQVPNAVVVAGDALRVFAEILPDRSLAAVHVYFPDPWWKKRHRKRRVMRESFLRDVERTLRGGGLLHFWTDVEEYFTSTLQSDRRANRPEQPAAG